jgi:hypothetical protein
MTAREKFHQVIDDLPGEGDCAAFGRYLRAVKEGLSQGHLAQVYADLPQSTRDSVQRTLSRLNEEEPKAS